ncbi:MAG: putative porin [Bacteroidaceae bacterium]|nr:putative porin [Bacteroidaceae bacterium]
MRTERILAILLCLLPAIMFGQNAHDHAEGENEGGFGNGEVFSPFRNNPKDSTKAELKVPKYIRQWHVNEQSGEVIPVNADTLQFMFQNWQQTEGINGEYNFLGNMGTPRQTRIFFNRPTDTKFDFLQPYDYFYLRPGRFFFNDTKSPYTNLSYHSTGNRMNGDDRVRVYFSTNAGKKFGIGFLFDYLFARGRYDKQATSLVNISLFSYYKSDRYDYNLLASNYHMKQAENGGITDDRYITRPEDISGLNRNFTTTDIPVNLYYSWNRNMLYDVFFTHNYNMGFYRDKLAADSSGVVKDSVETEFVKVAKITHVADVKYHEHNFINHNNIKNYYADTFLPYDSTDATTRIKVKNRLAFSLCEGFSKYAFANITAFATHTYNRYTLPDLTADDKEFLKNYNEHNLTVGGTLSSSKWETLKYNVNGEASLIGEEFGAFNIDGDVEFNFKLWKRAMRLRAKAFIKNNRPSFYYRHYHSEHFWWDNDLSKEFKTRIEGSFEIPSWRTRLSAGFENIKNYTYIANESTPISSGSAKYLWRLRTKQAHENIQVFTATLKQDFKVWIFNLNTEVTYQHSSNKEVLPLPDINAYANFFLKFTYAKVLHTEIGVDARYFTKYYAPDYSPALGQFVQQNPENKVAIGNYPFVTVYANFLLKTARFYVKYYHVNKGSGNRQYFLAPHYPMNPAIFCFGLSWNFYN